MKKILKKSLLFSTVSIILIFVILFLFYRFAPGQFLKARTSYYKLKVGLKESVVNIDKYNWTYYHNDNKGETIVFVHGFTASKLFWLEFASYFKDYNIIIPDMPGHGKNSFYDEDNYSVRENVKRLNSFIRKLGLKEFYLVGISLGGAISAYYTYLYPEDVKKLVLIDSAGAKADRLSPYFNYILTTGENLLIYKDKEGFKKMFSFLMVKPVNIPEHIIDYYLEEKEKMNPRYEKIFSDLLNETNEVKVLLNENVLKSIKCPTLIIWGKEDKIIDVSSAYYLNKEIINSQLIVIDNVGHVPPVEKKEFTAEKIREFLKD